MKLQIPLFSLFLFFLSSCVTPKIHNLVVSKNEELKESLENSERYNLQLKIENQSLENRLLNLKSAINSLKSDSVQNGQALQVLQEKYNALSDSYELLSSKNSRFMAAKAKEIKDLLDELEMSQKELFSNKIELEKLAQKITEKEIELKSLQTDLEERSNRVNELEATINKKDSILSNLKNSISKALIGLEGDGLTVEKRNGKVYISLEEDLLFASGRYEINQKGVNALNKLSSALSDQKDLEILVEGHTDNIPLNGQGIVKDNWDLSVKRATSVVKVLTMNNNLDPSQLTAAGRAEYNPISDNTTKEGRRQNRRIEMILSPNLDDLFKLLE